MKFELTIKKLEDLLKEAKEAHVKFEKETGKVDKNWPRWYSKYIVGKLSRNS